MSLEKITEIFEQNLPGTYQVDREPGSSKMEIRYEIQDKNAIASEYTTSFLEFGVRHGPMETEVREECFEMDLELGENPYFALDISYSESDTEASEKAVAVVEDIECLLNP